ncbi:hypothetical protein [Pseudactinotalea suaedae]|uniref:hypothetical protein n=1 Tax=Pseudactinotalea suaedae TaxID=1524924 RepID=UPI0012E172F0|nr:hypothetical protein [Pseudactinotalea suaedae]
MTNQAEEFVLAEHVPGAAPARASTPLPASRRATTWAVVGVALVVGGVLTSPGPIYPPLEDGIAWNVLDLDLMTEPRVAWTAELSAVEVLGAVDGTVVIGLGSESPAVDEPWPDSTTVGLDARTGAELWRLTDGTCVLGADAVTCVQDQGSPDARVTNHAADGTATRPVTHAGAVVATRLDGGGLLVVEGGSTAIAELVRIDDWGAEMWRSRLRYSGLADSGYFGLDVVGGYVSAASGWFDLETGEARELPYLESDANDALRETLEDGSTLVTLADGREVHVPPGELLLEVDDALGGPVSLHSSSDGALVSTWDGGSATFTPSADLDCLLLARLQGALVEQCLPSSGIGTLRMRAIDQLTTEHLWEHTGTTGFGSVPATADTLVLSLAGSVQGVDPRTGVPRWSVPVAGVNPRVTVTDDYLIVLTPEAVIRLG